MKHEKVVLSVLLLITPISLLVIDLAHPTIIIGIVLVDETEDHYANEIIQGFGEYDQYFEARLLPIRFNASQVRSQTGHFSIDYYLNSDLVKKARTLELVGRYRVDLVLLFADHAIADWDDSNESLWAQAFPEHSAVLISSAFFTGDQKGMDMAARQLALHETMHLLGYTHNFVGRHGIMGYFDYSTQMREPLPYARFQMPLHCHLFALVGATSFVNIVALTRVTFALLLMPSLVAAELMVLRRYRRRQPQAEHHLTVSFGVLIGSFALLAIFVESFLVLVAPLALMVLLHRAYSRYHERTSIKGKDDR